MKKIILVLMFLAFLAVSDANAQTTTGDKITETTKKAAKATSKGVGKGYKVSKNVVVKGAKATFGGIKKIFS